MFRNACKWVACKRNVGISEYQSSPVQSNLTAAAQHMQLWKWKDSEHVGDDGFIVADLLFLKLLEKYLKYARQ